ncbi:hydroxymethylglutaryl-CoA lyase [Pontitalea aquivivens]|uniref:hydroxymethylglutaryl-CoA lyase n=1 Tax=Pontitalea aquivivens TaxID=3388663 RepID=UPI003970D646
MTSELRTASDPVILCECFARDGLQHETLALTTAQKIEAINRFADLGFPRVEATSYSHPKYVPQFADADEVLAGVRHRSGVRFKATCPNVKAVERAMRAQDAGNGPEEISLLVSASESHSLTNLKRSRADQWGLVAEMARLGRDRFVMVGTVSVAWGCPFEGRVAPDVVIDDARRMADLGVDHVAIGDTVGRGDPRSVSDLFGMLRSELPHVTFIAHFHDTRGRGLANCVAAYDAGVRHFDSAFGGVGGHPTRIDYGEGYTGNVCTEDLVAMFESMGISTGIDLKNLIPTAQYCERLLGRPLRGMVARSGLDTLKELDHE